MQRLKDESGAVAVIVLVTFTLLFGMGAIVVDVGALYQERRTLQNGADASVLAIAAQCGGGDCGDPLASADDYTNENADDGSATVEEICGSGVTGVSACVDPPDVPEGAGYVRVSTMTSDGEGGDLLPIGFARVFGFEGQTVHARSTAAWGGPAGLTSELPLTISQCEFDSYTDEGTDIDDPPPYDTSGYPDTEAVLYFHDTTGANPCTNTSNNSDIPGGFGWLATDGSCESFSESGDWYAVDTGASPDQVDCPPDLLEALVGTIVHIPVFDDTNGETGANAEYHVAFYASFYITGYTLGGQYKTPSEVTGLYPCNSPQNGTGTSRCISGFFVTDPAPVSGEIGGPSNGVTVVQLID